MSRVEPEPRNPEFILYQLTNITSEGDHKGLPVISENAFNLYFKMTMRILNKTLRTFKIVRKYFFFKNNKNYYYFLKYSKNFPLVSFVVSLRNLIGCSSFSLLTMGTLLPHHMMDCPCNHAVSRKRKKSVYPFHLSKVNGCTFQVYFVT